VTYMVFSVAGFQSSLGLCVAAYSRFRGKVCMCLDLSDAAWHGVRGETILPVRTLMFKGIITDWDQYRLSEP
jgi:hypothetical protein